MKPIAGRLAVVTVVVCALGLSACRSTQELSAERSKGAKALLKRKGLTVGRENPDVAIGQTAVLQDANGSVAVVQLRNTGGAAQVDLPVSITVSDAGGKRLYRNDIAGLDPSLVSVAVLDRGAEAFWVNNQVVVVGKPKKVQARVGKAKGRAPRKLPRIEVTRVRLDRDSDGVYARGVVRNRSRVEQKRLTISCVARRGGRIVAAGRAVVERLRADAKPISFTVFFIGNPNGARLSISAPPTVLE